MPAQLAAVVDEMRARGLIGADGWLTAAGRQIKERVEALTDELAAPAYDILEPDELDRLVEDLEPLGPLTRSGRCRASRRSSGLLVASAAPAPCGYPTREMTSTETARASGQNAARIIAA